MLRDTGALLVDFSTALHSRGVVLVGSRFVNVVDPADLRHHAIAELTPAAVD